MKPIKWYYLLLFSLLQAFLITNALQHNEREIPEVDIDWEGSPEQYTFSIRDNGKGIEPDFFEKIFEPFTKLVNMHEGAGLGLSIARKIVERHGGRIWLSSEAGSGSTFYFTLGK